MKKAKLQLALDDVLLEDALELVRIVAGFVDVIEGHARRARSAAKLPG